MSNSLVVYEKQNHIKGVKFVDFEETEINFNQFVFNLSVVNISKNLFLITPVTILFGENRVGKTVKYIYQSLMFLTILKLMMITSKLTACL